MTTPTPCDHTFEHRPGYRRGPFYKDDSRQCTKCGTWEVACERCLGKAWVYEDRSHGGGDGPCPRCENGRELIGPEWYPVDLRPWRKIAYGSSLFKGPMK